MIIYVHDVKVIKKYIITKAFYFILFTNQKQYVYINHLNIMIFYFEVIKKWLRKANKACLLNYFHTMLWACIKTDDPQMNRKNLSLDAYYFSRSKSRTAI